MEKEKSEVWDAKRDGEKKGAMTGEQERGRGEGSGVSRSHCAGRIM